MKAPAISGIVFCARRAVAAALYRRVFLDASRQPGAAAQRRGYRSGNLQRSDFPK